MSSASQASTGVRARRTPTTSDYSALLQRVRAAGLLERRTGFYLWLTGALLGALAAALVGVVAVRDPLWQLVVAVITGLILAQLGFVAHEAAHREVFASGPANDRFGRLLADLVVGISYSSWKSGHNRHHANPNQLGKDPSVDPGVFVFTEEQAATARGTYRWYLRRQGLLYYPVLLLAGLNLYIQSFATVMGRSPVERRWQELALLLLRTVALLAVLASAMPWGRVVAFLGVQVVAFGVATASSFIVNHVGMPVLPANAELDYLRRQVTTSRNIRGGWAATAWMGGLNFQIEHHLFPSMPRPNLRAASAVVKQYCAEKGIGYTEVSLPSAYAAVHRYMAYMGSRAGLPSSACPTAGMLGR